MATPLPQSNKLWCGIQKLLILCLPKSVLEYLPETLVESQFWYQQTVIAGNLTDAARHSRGAPGNPICRQEADCDHDRADSQELNIDLGIWRAALTAADSRLIQCWHSVRPTMS